MTSKEREVLRVYQENLLASPQGHVAISIRTCSLCCGMVKGSYSRCFNCNNYTELNGGHLLDLYAPVSLAFKGTQFYENLAGYKHPRTTRRQIDRYHFELTTLLRHSLRVNEESLKRGLRGAGESLVTWIPSTKKDSDPMAPIVRSVFPSRARQLLSWTGKIGERRRDPDQTRFEVSESVAGKRVLILDDLWTSGAHIFSATGTLKKAGATRVGAVTLGRFIRGESVDESAFVRACQEEPFTWIWYEEETGSLF